jgi:hypothetical protein
MADEKNIPLIVPVKAHGQDITSIRLVKPIGKHLRECGSPTIIWSDENGVVLSRTDYAVISKYIVALGDVPRSTVDSLDDADYQALGQAVVGFFQEAQARRAAFEIKNAAKDE